MPFTHAFTGSNPVRVTIVKIKSERTSFRIIELEVIQVIILVFLFYLEVISYH